MRRTVILSLLVGLGILTWWIGSRLDRWYVQSKISEKFEMRQWEERVRKLESVPSKLKAIDEIIARGNRDEKANMLLDEMVRKSPEIGNVAAYRKAEIFYFSCERHMVSFDFLADAGLGEQAGEERDKASKKCSEAKDILLSLMIGTNDKNFLFYVHYALGNVGVRRAGLAASKEELNDAINGAIESYIAALRIRDDYQTRFNLELLLNIQKNRGAGGGKEGKGPLESKDFQLKPSRPGEGAAPSSKQKSRL